MSEFDDFIRGIGSDIKSAAEQVGKKAEETFEISKRKAEKVKLKGRVQSLYQRLGEITYGGIKNGEDVSSETEEIIDRLDAVFGRIEELFDEINAIKNGTFVPEEEEMDWEEEYAEGYDEETEAEEVEEEFVAVLEGEVAEAAAEEEPQAKAQEFDINID